MAAVYKYTELIHVQIQRALGLCFFGDTACFAFRCRIETEVDIGLHVLCQFHSLSTNNIICCHPNSHVVGEVQAGCRRIRARPSVDLQPDTGTTEGAAPDGWQSVRGEERTIGCGVGAARRLFTDDGKRQPGRLRRASAGRQVAYTDRRRHSPSFKEVLMEFD